MNLSKEPDFSDFVFCINAIHELQKERDRLLLQVKDAVELTSICSDWNLYEVEIQGEMVNTIDLQRRFISAVNDTKHIDRWQQLKDRLGIDEEEK